MIRIRRNKARGRNSANPQGATDVRFVIIDRREDFLSNCCAEVLSRGVQRIDRNFHYSLHVLRSLC